MFGGQRYFSTFSQEYKQVPGEVTCVLVALPGPRRACTGALVCFFCLPVALVETSWLSAGVASCSASAEQLKAVFGWVGEIKGQILGMGGGGTEVGYSDSKKSVQVEHIWLMVHLRDSSELGSPHGQSMGWGMEVLDGSWCLVGCSIEWDNAQRLAPTIRTR